LGDGETSPKLTVGVQVAEQGFEFFDLTAGLAGGEYRDAARFGVSAETVVCSNQNAAVTDFERPRPEFGGQAADALDVEIIAPSHGVIWRKNIATILAAYRRWVEQRPAAKVIVLFDTMWRSTEIMARAILEGAAEDGVSVLLMHARENHKTEIVTEALDAAAFAVGSPTLNTTLMPDMAGVLTYMKGLKPVGKCGFAFGSYGWSKGGAAHVEAYLKDMRMDILREPIQAQFVPDAAVLEECRNAGRMLAAKARELSGQDAKTVESV